MSRSLWFSVISTFTLTAFAGMQPAVAQEEEILEEVTVTGSRASFSTADDAPVPVSILTNEMLTNTGATELGRAIQAAAPSFNFSSSTISDGTDALRPATLRGLGPDQTLVLINGKRRHTSALVHVNTSVGRGTAGTDMNAIPISAVKRVEVLRDGAAAQYGSDAIAGVINIILKDSATDGIASMEYGETFEGDGETWVANVNSGFALGSEGFVNLTYSTVTAAQPTAPASTAPGNTLAPTARRLISVAPPSRRWIRARQLITAIASGLAMRIMSSMLWR